MAHSIRSIKPANQWIHRDLVAYNISIVTQPKEQFFHTALLQQPQHPSLNGFMSTQLRQDAGDDETEKLLHYLELAEDPGVGQVAGVDNLVAKLFEKLEYDDNDRIIFIGRGLSFDIGGDTSSARTNVCVTGDDEMMILLVQTKKFQDPEPQVIAEAIAAYADNNMTRTRWQLRPHLPAITFPAIAMHGTYPIFYRITVTAQLCDAVAAGMYPPTETRVLRYVPDLPLPHNKGMHFLQNRIEILTCLEKFKQFLGN
ncbi:hypothetical protein DFH29DRAFT_278970 [Suillus ampliporus]|nr:hypothetical protein DFH29DRAFT_278970 [Suillus ampliporus]